MTTRSFTAMNTEWWITASGPADLGAAEETVHEAERRLSRFLPDSALSCLNRDRRATDPWLAAVVRQALEACAATEGAFDPRTGGALLASGYDRSFELMSKHPASRVLTAAPAVEQLSIRVKGDCVTLEGDGQVDLGGLAKGWTVDLVAARLTQAGATSWLIDGGGDLRGAGAMDGGDSWMVGVGEGVAVRLDGAAVCTSSTRKRRWTDGQEERHHIIDPSAGAPACSGVVTAVVVAGDTTTADMLATSVVASPDRGLRAAAAAGAGVLLERDGEWHMTERMERWLA